MGAVQIRVLAGTGREGTSVPNWEPLDRSLDIGQPG
jgi:hypothetical protein